MGGETEHGGDRTLLDQAAGEHDRYVIAGLGDDAEVVGDDQRADMTLAHRIGQQVEDLRLQR